MLLRIELCRSFFFNDPATTEIYTYLHTLSLHDALPIWSLTAKISATRAIEPEVMNCFTPLITHVSPTRRARVCRAEASEPACGSVRQKDRKSTRLNSSH